MRPAHLILVVVLLFWPCLLPAADGGNAEGTMKVDGITVPLSYAYALVYGNEEGMLGGPELRLLLADREVPLSLLSGPILDRLDSHARRGEVRGLVLRLDLQRLTEATVSGSVLLAPTDPETSLMFVTLTPQEALENLHVTEATVSGKLAFAVAGDSPGEEVSIAATFHAPNVRDELSARLSEPAAVTSPPVQALLKWNEALRVGDFERLRDLSTTEKYREVESFRLEVGDDAFRKMVASEVTPDADLRRQIKVVIIRGERAFVVLEDEEGRTLATALRVGDRWIVD